MRFLIVAAGLLAAITAQAAVYRCQSTTGVTFTDRACPGGIRVAGTAASPRSSTTATGLSTTEQALLADIDQAVQRQSQAAAQQRAAQAASASARSQARADACARAERELEQLRLIRRKGYKATQARTLELREAKQRAIADASCS